MTILVTGANGNIGSSLVETLCAQGHSVRAAARDLSTLRTPDGIDTVQMDLTNPSGRDFATALDGVRTVFLYPALGRMDGFLQALSASDVEHVVLLSSPDSYEPIGHQRIIGLVRQQIEQGIVRSGVAHTVLYPSWLATNALRDWGAEIRTSGTVSTAYPDARMTPIHIDDVAWVVGGAPGTTAVVQQLSSRTVGLTGAATPGIDFRRPNLLVLIQNLVPVVSSNPIDMPQNSMRRGAGDNSSCARA
jgi:uncharacterized protein YbjT (DUF2867 family)